MSGEMALREALLTALRADVDLMALVNAVEDGSAAKVTPPALTLGAFMASEWGARGVSGLAMQVPLTLTDRMDRPDRLGSAAVRIGAVMAGLPDEIDGWRVGAVRFERSRTVRGGDGQWSMLIDYGVRLSRLG